MPNISRGPREDQHRLARSAAMAGLVVSMALAACGTEDESAGEPDAQQSVATTQADVSTTTTVVPSTAPPTTAPPTTAPPTTAPPTTAPPTTTPTSTTEASGARLMTTEQITLTNGDLTFDALAAGPESGPVVLLLHAFPDTNAQWSLQIDAMAEAGYRVVAPNLRGYSPGAQPPEVSDYSVDLMAGDIIAMADELGAETVHLVGHDVGAVTAWHTAVMHPDRVASLVSISSPHPDALAAAANDPDSDQMARLDTFLPVFSTPGSEQILMGDDARVLRTAVLAGSGLEGAELDETVAFFAAGDTMKNAMNFFRAGGLDTDGESLGAVSVPTMYIWGVNDPQLGPDAADATAEFVAGEYRFEPLDGVAHWVTREAPETVNGLLIDHLNGF